MTDNAAVDAVWRAYTECVRGSFLTFDALGATPQGLESFKNRVSEHRAARDMALEYLNNDGH